MKGRPKKQVWRSREELGSTRIFQTITLFGSVISLCAIPIWSIFFCLTKQPKMISICDGCPYQPHWKDKAKLKG